MTEIKVDYIGHMGSDLTVVNAARVSFDKESQWEVDDWDGFAPKYTHRDRHLSEKDEKLINYLADHEHLSPFGHCFASFRVTAPVFVSRQLVKHKFLRINEVSRRYVDDPPEFYIPKEWRGKPVNKKQGSDGIVDLTEFEYLDGDTTITFKDTLDNLPKTISAIYDDLIMVGVAPEMARMILPQNMMTSWYWSGSLDAFANMANLRLKPDAQYETRLVAEQIDIQMKDLFPIAWKALVK